MRNGAFILFVVALLVPACRAEARWCDVIGHGDSEKLTYPPIARAARVSGIVLAQITYSAQGDVQEVATISGPPMLAKFVSLQLRSWHLKTNASGSDPCQSLAIIEFRLVTDDKPAGSRSQPTPASILRISVEAVAIVLTNDEMPTLSRKRRFSSSP